MELEPDLELGAARVAAGAAPGPAWHPDDYFSTWPVYFIGEAADVGSPGDGNAVAAWANRGSADIQFIQGTAGNRPLWRQADAGLNGKPALDFDGTDDFMPARNEANSANALLSLIASITDTCVVIVLLPDLSATDSGTSGSNDNVMRDGGYVVGAELRGSGVEKSVRLRHSDGGEDVNVHTIVYGQPLVIAMRHSAGSWVTSVNGGTETSVSSGNSSGLAAQLFLGGNTGAGANMNGRLALFAGIIDGAPTDLATAITNLKTYYGIA